MFGFLKTIGRHVIGAVAGGIGLLIGNAGAATVVPDSTEAQVAAAGATLALALYAIVEKTLKSWIGE